MKSRAVVAGGLLALAGVWAISAVGQATMEGPAEIPPLSYEGREYVDSTGCMFIRAGVDGNVVWVPRVTRNREPVCGLPPTFTPAQLAALGSGSTMPAASASLTSSAETLSTTYTTSAVDSYNTVSMPASSGAGGLVNDIFVPSSSAAATTYVSEGSTYSSPQPQPITTYAEPVTYSAPTTYRAPTSSGSSSVVNDIYVGPQTYTGGSTLSISVPNSRGAVPAGYRAAWDDGRLNPNRGPRSSQGDQAMYSVWTDSVPMELGGAKSTRRGIRSVIPFMSGKSVEPQGSGGGFIQIGTFGQPENVGKSIARLQSMGIAAAIQQVGSVQTVLAGPFADGQTAAEALAFLRSHGYSDAFITR